MVFWVTETYKNGFKHEIQCLYLCDFPIALISDDAFMAWKKDVLNIRKAPFNNGRFLVEVV